MATLMELRARVRARSEDWHRLAERLPDLDLDADEELAADLLAPRYSLDSQGRRVVEPKSETKRRLRRSPDRADAVVMAFAVDRKIGRARISVPRGRIAPPRDAEELVIMPPVGGRGRP
jgi:hypothetical protein